MWAWGAADRGQSGLGGKTYAPAPRRVEAFGKYHSYETVKVQQIAAGDAHSLLLTQSGDVYVCGDNYRGQLGLAPSAEVVALDKEREAMEQELHFLQQARPPPPPSSRTKWTRLIHPSVLIGHVSAPAGPGAQDRGVGGQGPPPPAAPCRPAPRGPAGGSAVAEGRDVSD